MPLYNSKYKCPVCNGTLYRTTSRQGPLDWAMCHDCGYNDYIIFAILAKFKYPFESFKRDVTKGVVADVFPAAERDHLALITPYSLKTIARFKYLKDKVNRPFSFAKSKEYYERMMTFITGDSHYTEKALPLMDMHSKLLEACVADGITPRLIDAVNFGDPYHFAVPIYKERNNMVGFYNLYKHPEYDRDRTRVIWKSYMDHTRVELYHPYLAYKETDQTDFRNIVLINDLGGYLKLVDWIYGDCKYDSIMNIFDRDTQVVYLAGSLEYSLNTLMDYNWKADCLINMCAAPGVTTILYQKLDKATFSVKSLRTFMPDKWGYPRTPIIISDSLKTLCHYVNEYFKLRTYRPNMYHTELPEESRALSQSSETPQ